MAIAALTETVPIQTNKDGVMLVGGTRVTLDTVVSAFNDGATAEEICLQYPSLQLADIYFVIAYYLRNKKQVDAYLKRREKEAREVRKRNEERFERSEIRKKILARKAKGKG